MISLHILVLLAIVAAYLGLGIVGGMMIERLRWNALITRGVLPRPKKRRR